MLNRKTWYFLVVFGLLLGIHDGKIALWKDEDPQPIQISPYRASLLPPADQNVLKHGIPIEDEHHLNRLLQDYLS